MEKLTKEERVRRRFSESFKRKKVLEIESGISKIGDICRQYQVRRRSIDLWRKKYGSMQQKKERLIVETESDTLKIIELSEKLANEETTIQLHFSFKRRR